MDAIFPTYISIWYQASKTPKWNPLIRRSISGKRRSLLFYEAPIWEITLPIGHLYDWEVEIVNGFFNRMSGPHETFYFLDPMNKQTNLVIGTGDGVTTDFQLFRSWGYDDLYQEYPEYPAAYVASLGYGLDGYLTPEIQGYGVPVPETPAVYADGVLVTGNYSLTADGKISFDTAPALGVVITATFYFCYKVAFSEDAEFAHIYHNAWSTNLKLETVRS